MSYDSITNRGDYLSPHYLAEVLPRDLKKPGSLRARWAERDKAGEPTPVKGLRALRRPYFETRLTRLLPESERQKDLEQDLFDLYGQVLRALGYPASPRELIVERAGEQCAVQVAYAAQNVVAVNCEW